MAVRRESVELSLVDDGFSTKAAKDAAAIALLNRELDRTDGASLRANHSTTALGGSNGGISRTGQAARSASSDLDKYSGRLNLLATAAATVGPVLLPITAAAIPALTSLAGGLGAAAGAVGTTILAVHGLGDALKALDAYQLNPTDATLKKLNETFGQLSPAAQDLVSRLDSLEPVLSRLQETAQDDMFPGFNAGLDQILTLAPEVQDIVGRIATELGRLGASAGESLANDSDWQAFFTYIKQDAEPILDDFARATGNFIAGLGSILVAFRPLSDDFSSGLLDMSRDFREWSANLSDNAGFQDFVDYIRTNGPAVRDFFGALADAFVGLVKAAAPWGSTMLPILSDLAKVFGSIAASPIGPVLYDTAAAMLVLNRAMAIAGTERVTRLSSGFTTLGAQLRTMPADLRAMGGEYQNLNRIQSTSLSLMSNTTGAANRVRSALGRLGGAARTAGGVGGFMLLSDGMERTNETAKTLETTAGAAAIGFAVGGPWGAAIGGATGLVLSFADGNKEAASASSELLATLDQQTGAFTEMSAAWVASQFSNSELHQFGQIGISIGDVATAALQGGAAMDQLNQRIEEGVAHKWGGDEVWQQLPAYEKLQTVVESIGMTQEQYSAQADASAAAQDRYGESSAEAAAKAQKLAEAAKEQRQAARQSAEQWITLGKSIDDTKVSLDGWIREMALQARALSQFADNAETAANRGLKEGLIKQLEAAGPAGAIRMKQLADGTAAQIDRANAAFAAGRRAIQAYVDMSIPPKQIRVMMNSGDALQRLQAIKSEMASIHDKTVKLNYYVNQVNAGNKPKVVPPDAPGRANGGEVPGQRYPYGDKVLIKAAPGEEVVSNRYGGADKNRAALRAASLGARLKVVGSYADGGEVSVGQLASLYGSSSSSGSTSPSSKSAAGQTKKLTKAQLEQAAAVTKATGELKHLQLDLSGLHGKEFKDLRSGLRQLVGKDLKLTGESLRDLNRSAKLLNNSLDAAKSRLQDAMSNRDSVASGITSGLSRDLWSVSNTGSSATNSNPWTTATSGAQVSAWSPQYAISQLHGEQADATEFKQLIGVVQDKGIKGPALGELLSGGGIDALRAFANAPAAVDKQYQQAYGQASGALAAAAKAGGQAAYGPQIAELKEIKKALNKNSKAIEKAINDRKTTDHASRMAAAKAAAKATADSLDHSAKNARNR